tara:strand:- start:259 stop:1473 length:1215 start_codon:yes stop_codon:yes gene_type:complete
MLTKKEDATRYKEKIFRSNFNVNRNVNKKLIWFHAVSIGELKSILPIIREINDNGKNLQFLITTVTLSSGNLIKEEIKKFNNIQHRFFPIDVNFLVKDFINLWKPNAIFLVDSEIWPNLINNIKISNIPLAIINARITSKSFKRWMFFSSFSKKIFNCFDLCLASNTETKNYLSKLNAKNIFYTGNIKLIKDNTATNNYSAENRNPIREKFWLAASTHKGEEQFCLKVQSEIKKKYKNVKLILAPRHIDRTVQIAKLCEKMNFSYQIINKNEHILYDKEIFLINFFGELPRFFKFAKSVFIGKSLLKKFEKVGGQNPIDAARVGCNIYHGPYVYNFEEIYKILNENNISKKILTVEELSKEIIDDFKDLKKDIHKFSPLLDRLGKKTFEDTMKNINNFLTNETK